MYGRAANASVTEGLCMVFVQLPTSASTSSAMPSSAPVATVEGMLYGVAHAKLSE